MSSFPYRLPVSNILRPEKDIPPRRKWLERTHHQMMGTFVHWNKSRLLSNALEDIHCFSGKFSSYSDNALRESQEHLYQQVRSNGYTRETVCWAFALIREVAGRVLGMRHFDSQLRGGLAMFNGQIAEMATGEGKTLTATLPVAAAAIAGIPVHVVTTNDYLAARDAKEMQPVYEWLGLSLGCIQQGMSLTERKAVYACDIVYCTNKELVFDYLKDYLVLKDTPDVMHRYGECLKGNHALGGKLMLRGLHFAVIDEADSVLMDEARTPLIISGEARHNEEQERVYYQAMAIARQLNKNIHYQLQNANRSVQLTDEGELYLDHKCANLGAYWVGRVRRYEIIRQALVALIFFECDRHYLICDNEVQIIDEHTGRVMPDRRWEKGLHQLIEVKEDCPLTAPRETLAKISYQRFFRRYHWLSGMTGTAREVVNEFWAIYALPVKFVATHAPLCRVVYPDRLCRTQSDKIDLVVESVIRQIEEGRSVLVGTSTVGTSEQIANELHRQGIEYRLLNAKQNNEEASIIAEAGQPGRVTIATSMAGRGTDIKLHEKVKTAGGLHVILTELQEASRIDRQLAGRCARFGDPGSTELIVSLEDEWMRRVWYRRLLLSIAHQPFGQRLGVRLMKSAQHRLEKHHRALRYRLLEMDEQQSEIMAFINGNV